MSIIKEKLEAIARKSLYNMTHEDIADAIGKLEFEIDRDFTQFQKSAAEGRKALFKMIRASRNFGLSFGILITLLVATAFFGKIINDKNQIIAAQQIQINKFLGI